MHLMSYQPMPLFYFVFGFTNPVNQVMNTSNKIVNYIKPIMTTTK